MQTKPQINKILTKRQSNNPILSIRELNTNNIIIILQENRKINIGITEKGKEFYLKVQTINANTHK